MCEINIWPFSIKGEKAFQRILNLQITILNKLSVLQWDYVITCDLKVSEVSHEKLVVTGFNDCFTPENKSNITLRNILNLNKVLFKKNISS